MKVLELFEFDISHLIHKGCLEPSVSVETPSLLFQGCVAPDPAGPGCTSEEALYQMPDGTILVLRSSMRVRCTERLFEKDHGLPSLLWRSITMADVDIRQEN